MSQVAEAALHHYTLPTASSFLLLILKAHLVLWLVPTASTTGVSRHILVVFSNLANDIVEGVVDVDARLGGGLDELAAERSRELLALCEWKTTCQPLIMFPCVEGRHEGGVARVCASMSDDARVRHVATISHPHGQHVLCRPTFCAHLPLRLQITLVAHDDYGEVVLVLDPQYLLLECDNLFEALPRRDAVDEQKAFACSHVLLAHGRILFLTSGIEYI